MTGSRPYGWCVALIAVLALTVAPPTQAFTASQAASKVEAKVRATWPHRAATREVIAKCRQLHQHRTEFFCKYGIHGNLHDGIEGTSEWIYSGTADVQAPHGHLRATFTGPLREGGDFAPWHTAAEESAPPAGPHESAQEEAEHRRGAEEATRRQEEEQRRHAEEETHRLDEEECQRAPWTCSSFGLPQPQG